MPNRRCARPCSVAVKSPLPSRQNPSRPQGHRMRSRAPLALSLLFSSARPAGTQQPALLSAFALCARACRGELSIRYGCARAIARLAKTDDNITVSRPVPAMATRYIRTPADRMMGTRAVIAIRALGRRPNAGIFNFRPGEATILSDKLGAGPGENQRPATSPRGGRYFRGGWKGGDLKHGVLPRFSWSLSIAVAEFL